MGFRAYWIQFLNLLLSGLLAFASLGKCPHPNSNQKWPVLIKPIHVATDFIDLPFSTFGSFILDTTFLTDQTRTKIGTKSACMKCPLSEDRPLSQGSYSHYLSNRESNPNRSKSNPNLETLSNIYPHQNFIEFTDLFVLYFFCLFVIEYFSFWFSTSFAPWSKSNFSLLISPTEITTGSYFDFNVSWSWTEEVKILFGDELLLLTVVRIRTMGVPKVYFKLNSRKTKKGKSRSGTCSTSQWKLAFGTPFLGLIKWKPLLWRPSWRK